MLVYGRPAMLVEFPALAESSQRQAQMALVVLRSGIVGLDRNRLVVVPDGFVVAAERMERVGIIRVGIDVIGLQREGFLQRRERLGMPIELVQGIAEILCKHWDSAVRAR